MPRTKFLVSWYFFGLGWDSLLLLLLLQCEIWRLFLGLLLNDLFGLLPSLPFLSLPRPVRLVIKHRQNRTYHRPVGRSVGSSLEHIPTVQTIKFQLKLYLFCIDVAIITILSDLKRASCRSVCRCRVSSSSSPQPFWLWELYYCTVLCRHFDDRLMNQSLFCSL